jgi:hypothetical protein
MYPTDTSVSDEPPPSYEAAAAEMNKKSAEFKTPCVHTSPAPPIFAQEGQLDSNLFNEFDVDAAAAAPHTLVPLSPISGVGPRAAAAGPPVAPTTQPLPPPQLGVVPATAWQSPTLDVEPEDGNGMLLTPDQLLGLSEGGW